MISRNSFTNLLKDSVVDASKIEHIMVNGLDADQWSMESVLSFRSSEVVFAPNTGFDTHHVFSCVAAISFLDACHCILTQSNNDDVIMICFC